MNAIMKTTMIYFLIIFTLLLALALLLKDYVPARFVNLFLILIVVFLVASTVTQIVIETQKSKAEWQARWSGQIISPYKSDADFPVICLGESKIIWQGNPNEPVFVLAGEPLFIRLVDGKAQLSVVIRDENGNVIAAIRDNEWFVAHSTALDRNFNTNTLEVKDLKGDIVFQVQIEGEEVRIAGIFYSKEGGPSALTPWLHELQGRDNSLFLYPSEKHPGELTPISP